MRIKKTIDIKRKPLFLVTNIAYAQVPHWFGMTRHNLYLHIIHPQFLQDTPRPLIVWLCGGAWKSMDAGAHLAEMTWFAENGYIVASIEYRSVMETIFPGQLQDVKAAIRYLRAHSAQYGIDQNKVTVMGESAGGHLACMAGLTGDVREYDVGDFMEESSCVQAVVDWYGPTDLQKMVLSGDEVVPPETLLAGNQDRSSNQFYQLSPVNYVVPGKNIPPFLILHGNQDATVPFTQSVYLYEALQKAGVRSDLIEIEGADHADIHFSQLEIKKCILEFLNNTFGEHG